MLKRKLIRNINGVYILIQYHLGITLFPNYTMLAVFSVTNIIIVIENYFKTFR